MNVFEINGSIETPSSVSEDELYDAFMEFLQEKEWSFGGGISLVEENEDEEDDDEVDYDSEDYDYGDSEDY